MNNVEMDINPISYLYVTQNDMDMNLLFLN